MLSDLDTYNPQTLNQNTQSKKSLHSRSNSKQANKTTHHHKKRRSYVTPGELNRTSAGSQLGNRLNFTEHGLLGTSGQD